VVLVPAAMSKTSVLQSLIRAAEVDIEPGDWKVGWTGRRKICCGQTPTKILA
jgi:hypothetical protein